MLNMPTHPTGCGVIAFIVNAFGNTIYLRGNLQHKPNKTKTKHNMLRYEPHNFNLSDLKSKFGLNGLK